MPTEPELLSTDPNAGALISTDPSAGSAPNSSGALWLQALAKVVPVAGKMATTFAESPNAAKIGSAIARGGTTLGALGHGLATGNMSEIVASPIAGWQAGKGGYWLTKGAQSVAKPIGAVIEKAAPYAQTLSTLSGALGVGDLAQVAEPTRTDIGVLGIGRGGPVNMEEAKAKTEKSGGYLTKADADADVASVKKLIDSGSPPAAAVKQVSGENPKRFGSLMTLYLRSRQVK